MAWPFNFLAVILASGALWAASVALERALARRRRVSDGLLRSYHRDALRESAPQYVCWPTPAERAERRQP
jgi:hypothetical protein